MQFSTVETKWAKFGKPQDFAFLGKDVLATASGIYVKFLHLMTREERIERFDGKTRGDGASCLAGHPVVPMFCVAERRSNPKLSVFIYPSMKKVSCCTAKGINGYLSTAFAGTEYLLSLSTFPNFQIIVWSWKTGEKVFAVDTETTDVSQTIECSSNSPHFVSLFSSSAGKLSVYQLHVCSKIVKLIPVDTKLSKMKVMDFAWNAEGNLLLCDELCNVWLVVMETHRKYLIHESNVRKDYKRRPLIVAYYCGVILSDTTKKIAFYRKSSTNVWESVWSISLISHPVCMKTHSQKNSVFLQTENGEISEITIENDVPRVQLLYNDGTMYRALSSISSQLNHVIATDKSNRLNVFDVSTGNWESSLNLNHHGEVLCIDSHPTLPIIATGSNKGNCLFVGVVEKTLLKVLRCFHLQKDPLDKVRFSRKGAVLGIGTSSTGGIFVISKQFHRKKMDVVGVLQTKTQIIDFLIYYEEFIVYILVLISINSDIHVSTKIVVYTINIRNNFEEQTQFVIELPNPFTTLQYDIVKDLNVIGIPFLSRQLQRMEFNTGFQELNVKEKLPALHQLRNIEITANPNYILTYGYDGLVVVRNSKRFREVVGFFMAHHRSEAGTKRAIISGDIVISVGKNGDLVANRLCHVELKKTTEIEASLSDVQMFEDFTELSEISYETENTWMENQMAANRKKEEEEARLTRESILKDLNSLKTQIRSLLDLNEKESELKLPISDFDLDREFREQKLQAERAQIEESLMDLERRIARQDQVSRYLYRTFWETMSVHSCFLTSIFGETKVQNFPLPAVCAKENSEMLFQFSSRIRQFSSFELHDMECNDKLGHSDNIFYKLTDDERTCFSGTSTYKWIESDTYSTHQLLKPCDDYDECVRTNAVAKTHERRLKTYFNELFEKMKALKKQEMENARQRIDRLNYCVSELKNTFGIDVHVGEIREPQWDSSEIPELVIAVKEQFAESLQYETGNEEKVFREKRSSILPESEFCEKAVEKMMDGVLEVRWEDEIKKDVPKPECLITKDPSKFTQEDIEAVKCYNIKVEKLQREREKYKTMLETEIQQIKETFWSAIEGFNRNLENFSLKRIQIKSSILQEKLMRVRAIKKYYLQLQKKSEIILMNEKLSTAMKETRKLAEECSSFETAVSELKTRYENLCKREKSFEEKFRFEFSDLKQPMVEHLLRHYKKRPKIGAVSVCTSVTYLTEIAKCVITNEKSDILPKEFLDFLRCIDSLDSMPGTLPSQIDLARWKAMCKLRRMKIEMEMKVRSCAIELAESDQTLSIYQRLYIIGQNKVTRIREKLENLRRSLNDFLSDAEIQLIVKTGQIEISLQGNSSDFVDAILIDRQELLRVNEAIVKTGERKLTVMRKNMELRKSISLEEWRHKRKKLTLSGLKEELKCIRSVKVTKDVQTYLEYCSRGADYREELERIERSIEASKERYRRLISEEAARLDQTTRLLNDWKKRNEKTVEKIETRKQENAELQSRVDEATHEKDSEFRKRKLACIMRRTRLVKRVQENYENLLSLHAQLEVLKLRTYPTLKFRTIQH